MNISNVVLDRDKETVTYDTANSTGVWDKVFWKLKFKRWELVEAHDNSARVNEAISKEPYLKQPIEIPPVLAFGSDHPTPDQVKQPRYLKEDGTDTIDKWAATRSHEVFREIMYAQVEKYKDRLGKKGPILEEVTKMADYMNRWVEYEKQWAKEDAE